LTDGPAFHFHAAGGGVAVDPSGKCHEGRDRCGLGLFLPSSGEGELYIAVTPRSGDNEVFAERSCPCAGDCFAITVQVHDAFVAAVVACENHMPDSGSFAAILDWDRLRGSDAEIRKVGFLSRIAPQRNATLEFFTFESIDDEAGRVRRIQK
jgi:hypothetical protein